MRLSAKHAVYAGLLGLAAAALVVDRLWLTGGAAVPSQAQASIRPPDRTLPAVVSAASAAGEPVPAAPLPRAPASLADRLKALAASRAVDPGSTMDAFLLPESWIVRSQPTKPLAPPAPPAESIRRFEDGHAVTSVFFSEQGGAAIVNGKLMKVGNEIDGFKLVRVTAAGAVFASGGEEVELKLPKTVVAP